MKIQVSEILSLFPSTLSQVGKKVICGLSSPWS